MLLLLPLAILVINCDSYLYVFQRKKGSLTWLVIEVVTSCLHNAFGIIITRVQLISPIIDCNNEIVMCRNKYDPV